MCAKLLHSCQTLGPWTVACQAPLFMGFARQEHCSQLPFPSPGNLPDVKTKPASLTSPVLAGGFSFFTPRTNWEVFIYVVNQYLFQLIM